MMMTLQNKPNEAILSALKPADLSRLVGDVTLLMAASKVHRLFPIADLVDLVMPPLHLNQFRIYHDRLKKPVGIAIWGYFSPETLRRYLSGDVALPLEQWRGGDLLVFTDFIAPYGHARMIIDDLRRNIFPDATAMSLRFREIGKPRQSPTRWRGINA